MRLRSMKSLRYQKSFATPRVSSRIPPRTSGGGSVLGTCTQGHAQTWDRKGRDALMGLHDLLVGLSSRAGDDCLPPPSNAVPPHEHASGGYRL